MAVMDEFQEEREQVKSQPFHKRLAYFWGYHKWYVIGGIVVAVLLITLIRDIVTSKEDVMYAVVVNGYATENEAALADGFAEYLGIDTSKQSVSFHSSVFIGGEMNESSITSGQLITVYMAAGDLDVGIMDPVQYEKYAYAGTFSDLREQLSPEQLSALSSKLYYIDYAVYEEMEARKKELLDTSDILIPDPFSPETMADPRPVGISLQDCTLFTDAYSYEENAAFVGVVTSSESTDIAVKFLEYLFFPDASGSF